MLNDTKRMRIDVIRDVWGQQVSGRSRRSRMSSKVKVKKVHAKSDAALREVRAFGLA